MMYMDCVIYCVGLIFLAASTVTSTETSDNCAKEETSMIYVDVAAEMISKVKKNSATSNETSGKCNSKETSQIYMDIASGMINKVRNSNDTSCKYGEQETSMAYIDVASEMISKVQNNSATNNGTSGKCGQREISMAYIDAIVEMVSKVKNNFPVCNSCCNLKQPALDCADLFQMGHRNSGVYTISPMNRLIEKKSVDVYCDMETDGGGWTVIQRRGDFQNSIDYFYRNWTDYKHGFGDAGKEFWLGNENIFALTNQRLYSARFDLEDFEKNRRYAQYGTFWIDNENQKYTLHVSNYSGDAGDSLKLHNNQKFSTKDQDNDSNVRNCATSYSGAWWYKTCYHSNLNGEYHKGGIIWKSWKTESLTWTEIKIRPKNFRSSSNSPSVDDSIKN